MAPLFNNLNYNYKFLVCLTWPLALCLSAAAAELNGSNQVVERESENSILESCLNQQIARKLAPDGRSAIGGKCV